MTRDGSMHHCAFLTMDSLENFSSYDEELIQPLQSLGWKVKSVPWKESGVDWNAFELVIIRSTWDYQNSPEHFLEVLKTIDQSNALLQNSFNLIKWNINKKYLADLQQKGIRIVPTRYIPDPDEKDLVTLFGDFQTQEIIVKPLISANADNTFRLNRNDLPAGYPGLNKVFDNKECMVQPFIQNIIAEGEFSLIYFAGEFSHALLKRPKQGDYRVQEEHGGILYSIKADEDMLAISKHILDSLDEMPLYARVDLVRDTDNRYLLMELELIEPSLYFNMNADSANRFAGIIHRYFDKR